MDARNVFPLRQCVLLNAATASLPKPLKTPDTMKSHNTDLAPIITLTCNQVGVVKYEPSSPFTANITGFHIHAEDPKLWSRS